MARDGSLDVAVVGLSGRFPGSRDLEQWWDAILAGRVLTSRYDRQALLDSGVPAQLIDDADYVPVRGHLVDADRFDAALFKVSPREAELMDPQHRLMLEASWAALEDAGCPPAVGGVDGPVTSVFASITGSGYMRSMLLHGSLDPATLDDVIHGSEPDFVASRIAYKLGLTGPALAVQTACSSSLVAVHLAVQALVNGDCDQALVVAAGLAFPQAGHLHLPGGVLSPSGACRPFDAAADGVVGGSGVACVVLRRNADLSGDDRLPYGVILGTAINNDGSAKAGYYAPSVAGQRAVIRSAFRAADIDAASVGYLETHGTGTPIGDPIEWAAATGALRSLGARLRQVAIGALKANIGHLDAASGLAGLIKALFVVRSGMVPPVAGFKHANELLEMDDSPLYVPTEPGPWSGPQPRRAAISSFGIGGTNAHVIIEQPAPLVPAQAAPDPDRATLVLVSAGDSDARRRSADRLRAHVQREAPAVTDVAFTLANARAALPYRLAVTGRSAAEVVARLAAGNVVTGQAPADGPAPIVFLFPGQGTQYPGMAIPYRQALPGFSAALDRCLEAFEARVADRLGAALLRESFPEDELRETELAQPALFALGYAAAAALGALGVRPASLIGHSLGELTAAAVGGALTVAEAARLVVVRGRAMQTCPTGAMLALHCDEPHALKLISASGLELEIAAVNGPESCVVAGPEQLIQTFSESLDESVVARRLRTTRAFHSQHIELALPDLAAELERTQLRPLSVALAVNIDGRLIPAGAVVPRDMLVKQARATVRFGDAMASIAQTMPRAVVVEIGPGRPLSSVAETYGLTAVGLSPHRSDRPADELSAALGTLWTLGQPLAAADLCGTGRLVHLPTYPFEGPRWIAPEAVGPGAPPQAPQTVDISPDTRPPDVAVVMAGIWSDLLGRADLSSESDFFDLGGDSLLLTRLARRVSREIGVKPPLRDMVVARTLGRQTAVVLDLVWNRQAAEGEQ